MARYSIFSGSNTWAESRLALASLFGAGPLLDGPEIAAYEARFAEAAGTRWAFSLAAGRMALYRLLEALGIGPGDEVIIPAFTCVVVPNAIRYRGARPVYADIGEDFNIDPADAERRVTARTRAVMAQHTYGRLCDVGALAALARRKGLVLLEDAAHALGAAAGGRRAGGLAKAAVFSTDHSKVISTSTGGMITTDDAALAARLRALQEKTPFLSPARVRWILATFAVEHALLAPEVYPLGRRAFEVLGRQGAWAYFHDELSLELPTAYPYPARLSAAQARLGLSQLGRLSANLAHRRAAAAAFAGALGRPAPAPDDACLRFTWLVSDRRRWVEAFSDLLDMAVWFTSVVEGRSQRLEDVGYTPGSTPRAEFAAAHCVNLPTHERADSSALVDRLLALKAAGDPALALADFPNRPHLEASP